jgi:hypothetical protein
MIQRLIHIALLSLAFALLAGASCSVRMNSASIPPDVSTVAVATFTNNAPIIQPTLAQEFTIALQDRFTGQTRLRLKEGNADLMFSGEIRGYSIAPISASGATATQNRLTVSVFVKYENQVHPERSWEENFSSYADYDASVDLSAVERSLLDQIIKQLSQDIFNKALGNW